MSDQPQLEPGTYLAVIGNPSVMERNQIDGYLNCLGDTGILDRDPNSVREQHVGPGIRETLFTHYFSADTQLETHVKEWEAQLEVSDEILPWVSRSRVTNPRALERTLPKMEQRFKLFRVHVYEHPPKESPQV